MNSRRSVISSNSLVTGLPNVVEASIANPGDEVYSMHLAFIHLLSPFYICVYELPLVGTGFLLFLFPFFSVQIINHCNGYDSALARPGSFTKNVHRALS